MQQMRRIKCIVREVRSARGTQLEMCKLCAVQEIRNWQGEKVQPREACNESCATRKAGNAQGGHTVHVHVCICTCRDMYM